MNISIIIPAYNEENYILHCLTRIIYCFKGKIEFEVIVVNNASTDKTQLIASKINAVKTINLGKKVTVSSARNVGWEVAKFDNICFIDADVLLTNEWVDEYISFYEYLENNRFTITGCRYELSEDPGFIERSWFSKIAESSEKYIDSGNLITTKETLLKISGFDETLITGEDVDFCSRAQASSIKMLINRNFKAHHEGYPKSLEQFYLRERWHGVGDLKSWRTFLRSKVAIFSFLFTFLILLSFLSLPFNIYLFLLLFSASLILNFIAVIFRFKTSKINIFFLHMIYGFARTSSIFHRKKI